SPRKYRVPSAVHDEPTGLQGREASGDFSMSNFIHSSVVHRNAVIRLLWAIWSLLFACRLSLFCFATEIETQFPSPSNSPPWTCSARNRRRRDEPEPASADYGRFSTEFQDETTIESHQASC